jgi:hypothetical protein
MAGIEKEGELPSRYFSPRFDCPQIAPRDAANRAASG